MGDWENANIVTFLFVEKKIPGRKKITVMKKGIVVSSSSKIDRF